MKKAQLLFLAVVGVLLTLHCEPPSPGPPDAGLYHTYAELQAELPALAARFPALAQVVVVGKSVEQRDILALKISDQVENEEAEPAVLLVGGHHAREWISVDVPFLLAKYLLENYLSSARVKRLVDGGEIWIIPLLNPDGHQYSVTSDRLWRKNRANNGDGSFGVDLNRNYSYQWGGPGSSGDTYSETYRGAQPFSEPESRALRELSAREQFTTLISYHNYSQLVLFPWGYTNAPAPDEALLDQLATAMADRIRRVHGKVYTPQQSSDLYLASGDATDWLYGTSQVPAFTIELRPRSMNPGFVLPESEIQPTFAENLPAALFLIEWSQTAAAPAAAGTALP